MIYPAPAFAKGGDSEEHLGGVFVPSPMSSYRSGENYGIIKCHKLIVIIFTISFFYLTPTRNFLINSTAWEESR
jgi:hypothetical protein